MTSLENTTSTRRSILTYLVTKRFGLLREATFAAFQLAGCTGQADAGFRVTKTGPREWTVRGFVKDVDLDGERGGEIKRLLSFGKFAGYGLETYTSEVA